MKGKLKAKLFKSYLAMFIVYFLLFVMFFAATSVTIFFERLNKDMLEMKYYYSSIIDDIDHSLSKWGDGRFIQDARIKVLKSHDKVAKVNSKLYNVILPQDLFNELDGLKEFWIYTDSTLITPLLDMAISLVESDELKELYGDKVNLVDLNLEEIAYQREMDSLKARVLNIFNEVSYVNYSFDKYLEKIDKIMSLSSGYSKIINQFRNIMILIVFIAYIIFGIFFSRREAGKISNPIIEAAIKISNFVGSNIERRSFKHSDEIELLNYNIDVLMNYYNELSKTAEKMSQGNIHVNIVPKSQNDVMGIAFLKILNYFYSLSIGARQISSGNYNYEVEEKSEFDYLAKSYNKLSRSVKSYIIAYSKFVPFNFLDQLGKDSVLNMEPGDQKEQGMGLLFSDIRDFTSISETLNPKENFDFINKYLQAMVPAIRENGGFVDKFMGDGIMALFHETPADTLRAAVKMQEALTGFNKEYGGAAIRMGIGLHYGKVIIGTVGDNTRMDTTVISDNVNIAARLEELTKVYGSQIIASHKIIQSIEDFSLFEYRFLGLVKVKGKQQGIRIYEILSGLPDEEKKVKVDTKDTFEYAVFLYLKSDYEKSAALFKKVLDYDKRDKAAQYMLKKVNKYLKTPISIK